MSPPPPCFFDLPGAFRALLPVAAMCEGCQLQLLDCVAKELVDRLVGWPAACCCLWLGWGCRRLERQRIGSWHWPYHLVAGRPSLVARGGTARALHAGCRHRLGLDLVVQDVYERSPLSHPSQIRLDFFCGPPFLLAVVIVPRLPLLGDSFLLVPRGACALSCDMIPTMCLLEGACLPFSPRYASRP